VQPHNGRDDAAADGLDLFLALASIGRTLKSALARSGEDPAPIMLLHHVATQGPLRVSDLAGCAGLDASTVSRHVRGLEDDGYVERTEDPDDRRAWRLAVTPAGHAVLEASLRRRAGLVAAATADWPEHDRDTLTALGRRLADALARGSETPHRRQPGSRTSPESRTPLTDSTLTTESR
jgi:DNA-binding MarR family transcriptional regulator